MMIKFVSNHLFTSPTGEKKWSMSIYYELQGTKYWKDKTEETSRKYKKSWESNQAPLEQGLQPQNLTMVTVFILNNFKKKGSKYFFSSIRKKRYPSSLWLKAVADIELNSFRMTLSFSDPKVKVMASHHLFSYTLDKFSGDTKCRLHWTSKMKSVKVAKAWGWQKGHSLTADVNCICLFLWAIAGVFVALSNFFFSVCCFTFLFP